MKRIDVRCPKCGKVIPKMSIFCPDCLQASREQNLSKPEGSRKTDEELMDSEILSIYMELRRMRLDPRRYSQDLPIYDFFPD